MLVHVVVPRQSSLGESPGLAPTPAARALIGGLRVTKEAG
jgi:hypothetical protein